MGDFSAIFKAYDVRGTTPDQFDESMAEAIGSAFGAWISAQEPETTEVLVARDMRPSGVGLTAAFNAGVCRAGLNVVDLGLGSTDLLYFASGSRNAPGAMFTASHNPAGYNGIKFCGSGARPIGEDSGLAAIRDQAIEAHSQGVNSDDVPSGSGSIAHMDLLDEFADHVRSFVDTSALSPLKVVVDTANGMGGLVVPAVFDSLPFDTELMYAELDGTFPNHPADPLNPENQVDLKARVLEVGADVGLAFDGDADRVFLVDEKGVGVSGSTTTAILADAIVSRAGGGKVVHNLICSAAVPEVIREAGGEPIRSRVGHSFIKQVMASTDAIFGGEHSAHYYFRDNYRADSGLIAAILVLEQMSIRKMALSELRLPYERYSASGEINTVVDDPLAVIDSVSSQMGEFEQDRLDGLTVHADGWWFNLRPSNTEPLLRLNLEAPTDDEVAQRVKQVQAAMSQQTSES